MPVKTFTGNLLRQTLSQEITAMTHSELSQITDGVIRLVGFPLEKQQLAEEASHDLRARNEL
ncbi:hypothetical protein SAMN05421809_1273 [Natronorubrum daqingense]|uniref:Uncharacterized protein n=1 Tax=Natronorubrum daqingense TaxID=588898 RepID=A0A1N7BMR7_9EURY|nr:hypothetical protein BB347_07800 [Natronorubrum daqingense]SIR52661.1 hypothetical protein SAMN05421809_1273 [Natronorubrum daqingense]